MKKLLRFNILFAILTAFCARLFAADAGPYMYAHYIDVGQANATLLEFPCGAVLIDAGAQDDVYANKLVDYLTSFFSDRPDLTNTLDAVFITHPHKDHTSALKRVVQDFTVKNFIENGQDHGSGISPVHWVRSQAAARNIKIRQVLNSEIMNGGNKNGVTDDVIDPLKCNTCDPKFVILSGQWTTNPGWPQSEFLKNENQHSLVIRVDFGESSFLFPGDLETNAIQSCFNYYGSGGTGSLKPFDVDVLEVDHHGSNNGTTAAWLSALTPEIAVISVGHWNFGKGTTQDFCTWAYGHPRKVTIDLLSAAIMGTRSVPVKIEAATAVKHFSRTSVSKNIYATAWDGTTKIRASLHHQFTVTTHN